MNWFTKTCVRLFDLGLLPSRYKVEIDHNHQVRRNDFLGWFSHFEKIDPALDRYLQRKKTTYRIKRGYKPKICFWVERDFEIYKQSVEVKAIYTARRRGMREFLESQNILFTEFVLSEKHSLSRFTLFSPGEWSAVILACSIEDGHYYVPPGADDWIMAS